MCLTVRRFLILFKLIYKYDVDISDNTRKRKQISHTEAKFGLNLMLNAHTETNTVPNYDGFRVSFLLLLCYFPLCVR